MYKNIYLYEMFVCTNEQLPSRANKTIDIHTDTNAHTPLAHIYIQSIYTTAHIYVRMFVCKQRGRGVGRGAARMTTFGYSFFSCFCCSAGGVVEYSTVVVVVLFWYRSVFLR